MAYLAAKEKHHKIKIVMNDQDLDVLVHMNYGSHLYGLDTAVSDIDYKIVYMLTFKQLMLGNYPKTIKTFTSDNKEKNKPDDVDSEAIALPYFIELACKGETMALDMLDCATPLHSTVRGD